MGSGSEPSGYARLDTSELELCIEHERGHRPSCLEAKPSKAAGCIRGSLITQLPLAVALRLTARTHRLSCRETV